MNLIEQRLLELRQEYKTADEDRRRQIVIVAERIKKSAQLYPTEVKNDKTTDDFKQAVLKNLT